MTFITWEQRKKLFDELRTAENSAVVRINSGHSNLENELRELEEKIRNRNIVLENVVGERETAQLEKHPKKTINVRKEKDALSKQISALREAAEKMESEVAHLSTECEQRKEEKDMKVKEIKEIWDAHVQAMHIYKKNTKIYLDINEEDGNSFTVYFFQTDKESGSEYTVKLKRKQDLNQKVWEMISMNPHLPQEKKLQKHLAQTNDIQGFLASVRQLFKRHREVKLRKNAKTVLQ